MRHGWGPLSGDRTWRVGVAIAMFAAIAVWRFVDEGSAGSAITLLYVLPIALLGTEFGLAGGLVGAGVALVLLTVWAAFSEVSITAAGYATRAVVFVAIGAWIGLLVRSRAAAESRSTRWFEMSNDLLCEASLEGRFTRVNGSWRQTLGFGEEELLGSSFIDFVHPDDVDTTSGMTVRLAERPSEVVGFENRYRAKDGSWHWLLWSLRSDSERIYSVAKDVTERKALEAEREALLGRLQVMARTDDLTGLPNRRALDEELRRELARAKRHGYSLAVAMLDLDRFKQFNDLHGHQAGDDLLREAATTWRVAVRVSDYLARYGGEEFVVLMPRSSGDEPREIIERLCRATPRGQTCSAGVAVLESAEDSDSILARADTALYRAKTAGRDRIVLAESMD